MNTQKLLEAIPNYLEYLSNIGYSKFTMDANISVTNRFKTYCLNNNLKNVDLEVIEKFFVDVLNADKLKGNYKYVVKRVIKRLVDYANNEPIKICYQKERAKKLNCSIYEKLLNDYIDNIIIKQNIIKRSKSRKIRTIIRFLNYLIDNNIFEISNLTEKNVIDYLYFIKDQYSKVTLATYIGIIKEFTNYLYNNNLINYCIIQNLTVANKDRKPTPKYFNTQELQQILNSIDINKKNGKFHYLVILLLITYGLRLGDVMGLKFENINFEKNVINIVQSKTKKEISLYLTEQVKFAMLDYIKNERPQNIDSKYIFITITKPHRPYTTYHSSISMMITNIIKKSKVDIKDKSLGSRIFRHSLATNMINDNIPINNIQSLLGHTNSKTTAQYITRDINKLELLTLEVPKNGF